MNALDIPQKIIAALVGQALAGLAGPLYAQHDQVVANADGATVRADINNALAALFSLSSGTTAPSTTIAYQLWADTTNNLLKQRNAANTAWLVRGNLAEAFLVARSTNTILGVADFGKTFIATSTFTQTLTAAATLADGWYCGYRNDGSGVITIDPNAAETIDGQATITLQPGESCLIYCNGSAFKTIGRRRITDLTEDTAPALGSDYVETWDASATAHKKVLAGRLGGGVLGTVVASTSGTALDITSIPSWVKRITISISGLSTNGTSGLLVQIGDSGGIETTGYSSTAQGFATSGAGSVVANTAGFIISTGAVAAETARGQIVLTLLDSSTNTWVCGGSYTLSATNTFVFSGAKDLSATLDRLRLSAVNGTDAFDAGKLNILYE